MLGDVVVRSGDVVVGDPDGVVIIPRERLAATVDALATVREVEAATLVKVQAGLTVFPFMTDLLVGNRIRRV